MAAVIFFVPEETSDIVTIHPFWAADNGVETATFASEEEAREFCRSRWRQEPIVIARPW